jgi:hemoglobin/transferrin/lactoferrin receptor protein
VEVPSPGLDPERSVAIEAGVKWRADRTSAALSLWRTNLDALIDRVRARLDGSDMLDGQRIYQRQNVGAANVYGFELEIERVIAGPVTAYGWGAYAHGQQTTADQPMRRIPPFNGAAGVRWTGARFWGALQLRGAARQDRLAQGDREDHRMNPNGTPGWMTTGVNVAYRLSDGVRVVGGAENLFDRAYRVHASGIDGYGRYMWAGLHVGIAGRGGITSRGGQPNR